MNSASLETPRVTPEGLRCSRCQKFCTVTFTLGPREGLCGTCTTVLSSDAYKRLDGPLQHLPEGLAEMYNLLALYRRLFDDFDMRLQLGIYLGGAERQKLLDRADSILTKGIVLPSSNPQEQA